MRTDTLVGKVKSVTGNRISVQLDNRTPSTMPVIDGRIYRIGQMGSFLKITMGYVHLFGVVVQSGADAVPESLRLENKYGLRWVTLVLVGERVGDRFERGVGQYPTTDDEVHLVTNNDLELIYRGRDQSESISIGSISSSESLPARLNLNKLITRHTAILGSTGSGKSNAVTVLLNAIAAGRLPSARILVIDPHGEYSSALPDDSKVFKINADTNRNERELYVPYWALPFTEILKSFVGKLTDQQEEQLRESIYLGRLEGKKHLANPPAESSMSADSPVPFSLKKMWYDLDRFERTTFKDSARQIEALVCEGDADKLITARFEPHSSGNQAPFLNMKAKGIARFLDQMKNRLSDRRFDFLFHPGDWEPNLEGKTKNDLDHLLCEWIGHDKTITILDLSGVPSEIMSIVTGAVIKIVYDALLWGQNLLVGGRKQPLLIVLEEAHNYLQVGDESVASRAVRSIAKEGRKYGIGLLIVTQRPTEVDQTILSQCGTTIALRMSNSQDRSHVSATVQDDLSEIMTMLPSLRTGEGIVVGEAVHIPSRVRFDPAPRTPKSSDPDVVEAWSQELPSNEQYSTAVRFWREGRFKIDLSGSE